MNDYRDERGQAEREREALLTMLEVFLVGLVLISVVGRLIHLGLAVGTAFLVALPLVAASAGAWRLCQGR